MPLAAYRQENIPSRYLRDAVGTVLKDAFSDDYWGMANAELRRVEDGRAITRYVCTHSAAEQSPWRAKIAASDAVEIFHLSPARRVEWVGAEVAYLLQAADQRLFASAIVPSTTAEHLKSTYHGLSPWDERYPARVFAADVVSKCVLIDEIRTAHWTDFDVPRPSALLTEATNLFDCIQAADVQEFRLMGF